MRAITKPVVGETVRVRGQKKLARIEVIYKDIPGGVRLDRQVKGFWSWNVEDLVRVRRKIKPYSFASVLPETTKTRENIENLHSSGS